MGKSETLGGRGALVLRIASPALRRWALLQEKSVKLRVENGRWKVTSETGAVHVDGSV